MRMKKLLPIILGMTMSIMLMTGCGNSSNQSEESTQDKYKAVETEADNTTEYPITMKHAFGETIIESKPERIATVGWGNQDTPLALGVVPVGVSAANYGKVTENKLGYVIITNETMTDYGVDSSSAGNMINNFNNIEEVIVWVTISEDIKNHLIKFNIRSRGPIINTTAEKYSGGGHKFASGARVPSMKEAKMLLDDLDIVCKEYLEKESK